jgi:glycosidase
VSRSASSLVAALAVALLLAGAGAGRTSAPPTSLAAPAPAPSLNSDRIYFVLTDRYANGDPSNDAGGLSGTRNQTGYDPSSTAYWHGGDFKGLTGTCADTTHGLARIKSLGFNAIWVTPPFVNQVSQGASAGYHGYWGLDFTRVDPHLGANDDFAAFVACAHSLGMKVILDVVPNHTGDVIQPSGGSSYSDAPYRDCHGKAFNPGAYVVKRTFPCLKASTMPRPPVVLPGLANVKKPDWLNDATNYHNRGDIDFSSCSATCYEQGDVFGLDDLFTEKPVVVNGLAQLYGGWIARYKLDGFRVDTARHLNSGFWRRWIPQLRSSARSAGVRDFQVFGEVFISDAVEQSAYVRERGLPAVLDFPFQDAAAGYASGGSSALAILHRLQDDDYYRRPDGSEPAFATFLGNHDMGRAAFQIRQQSGSGISGDALLRHVELGYDLLYLLRGAPVVYYGDEVGMIGTGGDQAARQDMFPTQVPDWQTQARVGSPPIDTGSSFDVTSNPLETELRQLGALRDANPALGSAWSIVRYAKGGVLVVSRIDPMTKQEYLAAFNNGDALVSVPVIAATPSTAWLPLNCPAKSFPDQSDAKGQVVVTVPAVSGCLYKAQATIPSTPPTRPKLKVGSDDLTSMMRATATVGGTAPLSVAFLVRGHGGAWRRLDIDTSPPYRGFFIKTKAKLQVVAIARSLDGRTAISQIVSVR